MMVTTGVYGTLTAFAALTRLVGMKALHHRLAHYSEEKIMASIRKGANYGKESKIAVISDKPHECSGCMQGKSKEPQHPRTESTAQIPGQRIHMDIKGRLVESVNGDKYYLVLVDEFSRNIWTYPLKRKSESHTMFQKFLAEARSVKVAVLCVRADCAKELIMGKVEATCRKRYIAMEHTPPHTPKAAGKHETVVGDTWKHTMALIYGSNLSIQYWPYALRTATIVKNNIIHESTGEIPSIMWKGEVDDLSQLRAFGSTVYTYVQKDQRAPHQPKAQRYSYLTLKNRVTHLLLDTKRNKVVMKGNIIK